MNKLAKNSIRGMLPTTYIGAIAADVLRKFTLLFALAGILFTITSCEKDDDDKDAAKRVEAPTSIRLVNSTFLSTPYFTPGSTPAMTPVDLYVDNVKVTTSAIPFSAASGYFNLTSGSKKIEVKNGTTLIADTLLTIEEGSRYTFFIKDRAWFYDANTTTSTPARIEPLKRGLIPVVDNNTSVPPAGQAKVRFVNMSSMPLNTLQHSATFLIVNGPENSTAASIITQNLGDPGRPFSSDYAIYNAGPVIFRGHTATSTAVPTDPLYRSVDLSTTLEAGKLYTVYLMSTEYTVKTPTKSPISLKIVANE